MSEMLGIAREWAEASRSGREGALATVLRTDGSTFRRPGARMLILEDGTTAGSVSGGCLEHSIIEASGEVIRTRRSMTLRYDGTRDDVVLGEGAMCDGAVEISVEPIDGELSVGLLRLAESLAEHDFFLTVIDDSGRGPRTLVSTTPSSADEGRTVLFRERVQAPLRLVLCGAGALASSIARLSSELGWSPVVVDHRPRFLEGVEYPVRLIRASSELTPLLDRPAFTAVVIMTHHYGRDLDHLLEVLPRAPMYVGLLGSRARSARLVEQLRERLGEIDLSRLHAPTGLEMGSETIEETALSIVSEIQAVRRGSSGRPLRETSQAIHGRGSARVAALVLGAGGATRMGGEKLRLPSAGGEPLLRGLVREVASLDLNDLIVVTGGDQELGGLVEDLGARVVRNEKWRDGIATSIRCGVDSLGEEVGAVLIVLGDQPRITRADFERLVEAWRRTSAPVIATSYPEGGGVPAIFDRSLFAELKALEGDRGAKELIRTLEDARVLVIRQTEDVDDAASYDAYLRADF